MIELTFTGKDLAEVKEGIASFLDEEPKKAVQKTSEVKEEVPEDETEAKEPKKKKAKDITFTEIRDLALSKANEGKSKDVTALLNDRGYEKLNQLSESEYADFKKAVEEL